MAYMMESETDIIILKNRNSEGENFVAMYKLMSGSNQLTVRGKQTLKWCFKFLNIHRKFKHLKHKVELDESVFFPQTELIPKCWKIPIFIICTKTLTEDKKYVQKIFLYLSMLECSL